jgi:membrane protein implicated in regulation of membrane protease activity
MTGAPPHAPLGPVLRRYLLFQLPGWLFVGAGVFSARQWWGLSIEWALVIAAAWVAKDVVLFPIVRRAYEPDGSAPHGPIGAHGIADTAIDPEGWVRIGPERWRARRAPAGAGPIPAGAAVRIVGLRGHELVVEPEAP